MHVSIRESTPLDRMHFTGNGGYGGDCYFSVSCNAEYTRSNSALGKHPSVFFNIFRGNRSSTNNRSRSACILIAGQDNSDTRETNLLVCVCIPHCNSPRRR